MKSQDAREDTPLLTAYDDASRESSQPKPTATPIPWQQLFIILLLHLAEPLASQVIAPFLPQLILELGVTHGDDSRVGYYVGLVHALFYISQACTVFYWSRASDQIGRRPIALLGVAGLSISTYCVGLSKTFWGLALSRCLSGALYGNIGIIKSMVTEITDSTNMARAYSFLPMTWFLGATIGPLIGGSLERPAEKFPEIFGNSYFLKAYPYFLPCSIAAGYAAVCWFIVALLLKETVKAQVSPVQYFFGCLRKPQVHYRISSEAPEDGSAIDARERPVPFRELLVAPVMVAAGSAASFSLIDMSFRTVLPVYLATPMEMGGLGLDPPVIGIILAAMGISTGVLQVLAFAPLYNYLGGKNLFLIAVTLFLPITAIFPITNHIGKEQGLSNFVWFLVGLQIFLFVFASFALGVTLIYINSSAPNRASIGATYGIAQVFISAVRGIGPSAVNSAFALGIQQHVMGGYFAYWVMASMAVVSLTIVSALPKRPPSM